MAASGLMRKHSTPTCLATMAKSAAFVCLAEALTSRRTLCLREALQHELLRDVAIVDADGENGVKQHRQIDFIVPVTAGQIVSLAEFD